MVGEKFPVYDKGDIIGINFDPSLGHEQEGYRPALVKTNREAQELSGFVTVFPITSHDKDYPLHVKISGRADDVIGVVEVDQIISFDLTVRKTKKKAHANQSLIADVDEIFTEMTE